MAKAYQYLSFSVEIEKDADIIEFLAELKKKRQAAAFIKRAIRREITEESSDV